MGKIIKQGKDNQVIPHIYDIVTAFPEDLNCFKQDPLSTNINITNFIPDIDSSLTKYRFCIVRGGANIVSSCIYSKVPVFSFATGQDEQQISELSLMEKKGYLYGMNSASENTDKLYNWVNKILDGEYPQYLKHSFHARPEFSEAFSQLTEHI